MDEPGGQAKKFIVPDLVLFVNGIPLVVVECKSPGVPEPIEEAIDQLQRYANQRHWLDGNEGNEQLFHYNQFVVATSFDEARVGTFTAQAVHYLEWKDTSPVPMAEVAADARARSQLSSQEKLVAGMLRPAHLLDIVRHFTLFAEIGGKTDQDRRPLPAVPGRPARRRAAAHGQDPAGGRRARPARRHRLAHPGLGQEPDDGLPGPQDAHLAGAAALQGRGRHRPQGPAEAALGHRRADRRDRPRGPQVAHSSRSSWREKGPGLVFAMIQKYQERDWTTGDEEASRTQRASGTADRGSASSRS